MKKCCLSLLIITSVHAQHIVGYYPSWAIYARNYLVTDIPAEQLTHINYAFANISGGQVVLGDSYADIDRYYPGDCWDPGCERGNFHQLRILKQLHPHLKTLISVGGWTWSENFSDVAATPAARELFANSCAQFVVTHDFDGVDLDWEYPVDGGDWDVEHRPEDGQNLTLLCQRLRTKLDSLESVHGGTFLLTLAVSASPTRIAHLELPLLVPSVDFINVMTYDFHGAWESPTGFNSPLFPDPADPFAEPAHTGFNLSAAMQNYIAGGMPREKLNAGLAFYGHSFAQATGGNNGLYSPCSGAGPGTWENGSLDYWDIAAHYINMNGYTRYWHTVSQVPWLYNPTTDVFISYDDTSSIREKSQYIIAEDLCGAMFWELSADRNGDLLATVLNTFANANQLPAPQNLTITRIGNNLTFRWLPVAGAAQYKLWSSDDVNAPPENYTLELTTSNTTAQTPLTSPTSKTFFVTPHP